MINMGDEKYFNIICGLLLVLLVPVLLTTLVDYINSLRTGVDPNYSTLTLLVAGVVAFATIRLVNLTSKYAKSTKDMLNEQVKLRKIASIEKMLENVYSPMDNTLTEFELTLKPFSTDKIPGTYDHTFKDLNDKLFKIKMNYGHLFDDDIIKYYKEIWDSWQQYSDAKTLDNYKILNNSIYKFHDILNIKIKKEKEHLQIARC